jgi:hypothetical protein
LTSPDGRLDVSVPAGALAAPVQLTIEEITNTAPAGLGNAYRLGPAGLFFVAPVDLVFHADAGASVDALAIATQDGTGFWIRPPGLVRDPVGRTLATKTTHFSDWALVTASTVRDLHGSFALDSTLTDRSPFTATGESTLNYAGDGDGRSYYIQSGSITLSSAPSCTPDAATLPLLANVAELRLALSRFDWGVSGHWDLTCGVGTRESLTTAFDTVGINLIECSRGYAGSPLLGADRIQGSYAIDCGDGGKITGTWDFLAGSCGGPCSPAADTCHAGITDCSTGTATCVNGAPLANGTACGAVQTCNAGICVASRTVSGTRLVTYWTDAGSQTLVPADVVTPPLATVAALVGDGSGGWITYPGTLAADGGFSIPGVPTGTYLLVVVGGDGLIHVAETSSSTVDLGWDVLGRPDVVPAASPTAVTISTSGLPAWDPSGDRIELTSGDADVWDPVVQGAQIAAAPGGDVTEDWGSSAAGGSLNLVAAGDTLWAHHLGPVATTGTPSYVYRSAVEATSRNDVSLTSGQAFSVALDFTAPPAIAVPQTGSLSVTQWDLPSFEAALPDMGPGAAGVAHTLRVAASAHALASPAPVPRSGSPDLLLLQLAPGSGVVTAVGTMPYGQFLPAPLWLEWLGAELTASVGYLAPGASVALAERASVGHREAVSSTAYTLALALGPPRGVSVGGVLASTNPTGVGLAPTLSWTAPSIGVPSSYGVEIFRLVASGTASVATRVATLVTGSTQVALPAGVLEAGATYYLRVTAHADAPDAFATAPLRRANVGTWADALTGTFSP